MYRYMGVGVVCGGTGTLMMELLAVPHLWLSWLKLSQRGYALMRMRRWPAMCGCAHVTPAHAHMLLILAHAHMPWVAYCLGMYVTNRVSLFRRDTASAGATLTAKIAGNR